MDKFKTKEKSVEGKNGVASIRFGRVAEAWRAIRLRIGRELII
jgi:hypothetical protein